MYHNIKERINRLPYLHRKKYKAMKLRVLTHAPSYLLADSHNDMCLIQAIEQCNSKNEFLFWVNSSIIIINKSNNILVSILINQLEHIREITALSCWDYVKLYQIIVLRLCSTILFVYKQVQADCLTPGEQKMQLH